jgi:hypothetical protein
MLESLWIRILLDLATISKAVAGPQRPSLHRYAHLLAGGFRSEGNVATADRSVSEVKGRWSRASVACPFMARLSYADRI